MNINRDLLSKIKSRVLEDWWVLNVPFTIAAGELRSSQVRRAFARNARELDDALHKSARAQVISLDLFDTLVTRRVSNPDDVHAVVALLLGEKYPDQVWTFWPETRALAEHVAREKSRPHDTTIGEIYQGLNCLFASEILEDMSSVENTVEIQLCRPTARGKKIVEHIENLPSVRTVQISSDIYLHRETIDSILDHCFRFDFDRVALSGEDDLAKFNGSLFAHLRQSHPSEQILHIGDNKKSDLKIPKKYGLQAKQIHSVRSPVARIDVSRRNPRRMLGHFNAQERALSSLVESLIEEKLESSAFGFDSIEHIGYSVLGPVLSGFNSYLESLKKTDGVNRFDFIAREGAIFKRAFETANSESQDTSYLLLSTQLLGFASLTSPLSDDDLLFLTKTPGALTPYEFLTRINGDLGKDEVAQFCASISINPKKRFSREAALRQLRPLFEHFLPDVLPHAAAVRDALDEYLKNALTSSGTPALVDVGWVGTIQNRISQLSKKDLRGAYLGLKDTAKTREMPHLNGWFDERKGGIEAKVVDILYKRVAILEVLLAEPTSGTVRRLNKVKSGLEFSYSPVEFDEQSREAILRLQDAAIQFVRDFDALTESLGLGSFGMPKKVAIGRLLHLVTRPSRAQSRALSAVRFDGSYGIRAKRLGLWWIPDYLKRRL